MRAFFQESEEKRMLFCERWQQQQPPSIQQQPYISLSLHTTNCAHTSCILVQIFIALWAVDKIILMVLASSLSPLSLSRFHLSVEWLDWIGHICVVCVCLQSHFQLPIKKRVRTKKKKQKKRRSPHLLKVSDADDDHHRSACQDLLHAI